MIKDCTMQTASTPVTIALSLSNDNHGCNFAMLLHIFTPMHSRRNILADVNGVCIANDDVTIGSLFVRAPPH